MDRANSDKIADPVLANVALDVKGVELKDVQPSKLPDLFAGTQLLVLGRYTGQGKATVTLTGELNGKQQRYTYDMTLPERRVEQDFIPKLWANRQIGFLLEQIRLKGENKELKDEVIRLSKEHGIVTPYTAYLVEEPGLTPLGAVRLGLEAQTGLADGLGGGFGGGRMRGAVVGKPSSAPAGGAGAAGPRGPAGPSGAPGVLRQKTAEEQRYYMYAERESLFRKQADGYQRSTGSNAVEASKRVRQLKDSEVAEDELEIQRNVSGRQFRWQKDQWVDQSVTAKMTQVNVKYGSDAYFKLITANPEWSRYMSVGKQLTFRTGKSTQVVIGEKGKEKLTDAEVKGLEK